MLHFECSANPNMPIKMEKKQNDTFPTKRLPIVPRQKEDFSGKEGSRLASDKHVGTNLLSQWTKKEAAAFIYKCVMPRNKHNTQILRERWKTEWHHPILYK